jgi:hypothetical protein
MTLWTLSSDMCVQQRLARSVGTVPPGQKSEPRSLGSRIARETGILKPTDSAIIRVAASDQAVAEANERWPRKD